MSMKECAAALSGGRTKIYALIESGWLRTFCIGSRRYIDRHSFQEMIDAATRGVDVTAPRSRSKSEAAA
jgi:hypothetical protein